MHIKPFYRKNKKLIKELSSTLLWVLLLFSVIIYTNRAPRFNSGVESVFEVPDVYTNGTVGGEVPDNKNLPGEFYVTLTNVPEYGLVRPIAKKYLINRFAAPVVADTVRAEGRYSDKKE